jgi:hypothetical protein
MFVSPQISVGSGCPGGRAFCIFFQIQDQFRLAPRDAQPPDNLLEGNAISGKCKDLMATLEGKQAVARWNGKLKKPFLDFTHAGRQFLIAAHLGVRHLAYCL